MKPVFGLELINRRYSAPQHLKGNKLSVDTLNRTMKMKFRKVDDIKTARSEVQLYIPKDQEESNEQLGREVQFFQTHSKILRGKPTSKGKISGEKSELLVQPIQKEEEKVEKPRIFYRSPNLEEKMNVYLNSLINRSEEQHQQKLKEIALKLQQDVSQPRTTYNMRNIFWKRMRRLCAGKYDNPTRRQPLSARLNATARPF